MGTTIYLDSPAPVKSDRPRGIQRFVWPQCGPSPVKVALVWPWLGMGGAERWMISMAAHLQHVSQDLGGRQVVISGVVCQYPLDEAIYRELSQFAPVEFVPNPLNPTPAAERIVGAADIVIIGGFKDVRQLVRRASGPVVFIAHGACSLTTEIADNSFSSGVVTHYTAVSEVSRSIFPARMRDLVTVIENGGEVERTTALRTRDEVRRSWGVQPGDRVISYVGRFGPDKRSEALGEAIACLPSNYVGVLIGNGDQEPQALKRCQDLAPGRIRYGGHHRQIGDALAGMDAWLSASPSEGFCLSRIEASLAGVPVISTPTGDLPRLERVHGPLTWPIPLGASGEVIAREILRMFAAPDDMARMVERSRRLSLQHYTTAAMAARWTKYLRGILA